MPVGLPEFAANPENRVPVILSLDTSGSMSGQPIEELNRGIAAFKEDILRDTQAALSVEVVPGVPIPQSTVITTQSQSKIYVANNVSELLAQISK